MNWQEYLKGRISTSQNLAGHTTLKIGGRVQYWIEPRDLSDLQLLVSLAYKNKIPLRIIGAGSNILADSKTIRGVVVKLSSSCFKLITSGYDDPFKSRQGNYRQANQRLRQGVLTAGSALHLSELLKYAQEYGYAGLELLAGIPGTVGGALIMNSGNIGDRVWRLKVMDRRGQVKILDRRDIKFAYRSSNLNGYIILSAVFILKRSDKATIRQAIGRYVEYRKKTQDWSWPSAGCIFKNPCLEGSGQLVNRDGPSAAYLIECCGLKGCSIADAAVSFKHANFIVNRGRASFTDIMKLICYVKGCVRKRFNLNLEPEIKIWRG